MNLRSQILEKYRKIHPESNAMRFWTYHSNGLEKMARCIFCKQVIAIYYIQCYKPKPWNELKGFSSKINEHCKKCSLVWWVKGQVDDLKMKIKEKSYK